MVLKNSTKETAKYNLILMDCNMPIMNGFDTCIKLKQMMKEKKL